MSIPSFKVEVAFGSLPGDSSYSWTDISADVEAAEFARGKANDLDRIEAGTGSFTLIDSDGDYDPNYLAGAHYPHVKLMVPIRLSATLAGVTYRLCTHYVESWGRARVADMITRQVSTVDGFAILGLAPVAGLTIAQGVTGSHITAVLNEVGWPAGKRSVATGSGLIVAAAFASSDSTKALAYMQEVTSNEAGFLYMDGDGNVIYLDRSSLIGPPFNEIQAHFSDDPADHALPYSDPVFGFAIDRVLNDWTGTRPDGGTPQNVVDTTSDGEYMGRAKTISTLFTSDADVLSAMQHSLAYYKEPRERLSQITAMPGEDSAAWATLLALDIGDRVSVAETMPYGVKYVNDYLIEKVSMKRQPGSDAGAAFTYALWPVSESDTGTSGLRMNDAVLGKFNTGTLGW